MPDQDDAESPGTLRSYLQLLRLPNIFTAMADVAMGFLFVNSGTWAPTGELTPRGWWLLGLLVASSSLLYAAGVVLNDVFDLERDRQERPDRPLPSGRVSLRVARWMGGELLLFGTFLPCAMAWSLRQPRLAVVAVGLAVTILLYDRFLKQTLLGPLAMGACRMLNVLLGMSVLRGPLEARHWLVAGAIGLYVAGVTWFAREEVLRSDRRRLSAATLVMMAGIALLGALTYWPEPLIPKIRFDPSLWHMMLGLLGLIILMRCLWAIGEPSPGRVRMAVAQAILSLVFLNTAVTYAARDLYWACLVLSLLIPTVLLGFWIEST
jgi:4-hydroxybenzoate polyprenyltransferase